MTLDKGTFCGYILAIGIFIALALSFEWIYVLQWQVSSDLIYIESLYRDLFVRDYSLSGWLVSRAPYFFPDWIVYFLLRAFSGHYISSWYLYVILDFSFLLIFFYAIARYFHKKSGVEDLLFTLTWGALFILLLKFTPTGYGSHTLLLPVYHSGALINSLVIFWVWYRSLLVPLNYRQLFVLMLFSTVASISDQWWVIWFGIPIGLTTLGLIAARKLAWRASMFFLCAMGAGVVFGDLFSRLIEQQGWLQFSHIPVGTPAYTFLQELQWVGRDLSALFTSSPVLAALFVSTIVLCLLAIISWGYQTKWQTLRPAALLQNKTDAFVAVHIVVLLSFIVPFFPIVYLKMWEQWNYRYLHHFIALPWVMVGLYLFDLRNRNFVAKNFFRLAYFLPLAALIPLLTVANNSSFKDSRRGISLEWSSPIHSSDVACLDEIARAHKLRYGMSEYWDAKQITEVSRAGLFVNQFTYNYDALHWMNNYHWYKTPGDQGFVEYDFVVSSTRDFKNVPLIFGPPSVENVCGTWHIYIYQGEKKAQLNELIGAKLDKFFIGLGGAIPEKKNLLVNGDFELPGLKAWQYTAAQGSATFEQIPFGVEQPPIPNTPQYYARWKLNSPASYAFLEQRFDIRALAGKELALTFWARSPTGNKEFSSHGYLLPQGLLDKTAVSFGPTSGSPFTLTDKWQKFTVTYTAPPIAGMDVTEAGYALIRPVFFADGSVPTVDIAHVRLVANAGNTAQNNGAYASVLPPVDIGQLIIEADKSRVGGDIAAEFRFLKQAEAEAVAKGLKDPEILWRLARMHKQFADNSTSFEVDRTNVYLGAEYAFLASNLVNNANVLAWWGIMAAEMGRIEGIKQQNLGAAIFKDFMTRAIALAPADAELQALMGQKYFEWAAPSLGIKLRSMLMLSSMPQGSFEQARTHFARAVELEPNNIQYRLGLAKTLLKLENKAGAIEQLQAASRAGAGSKQPQLMAEVQTLLMSLQ